MTTDIVLSELNTAQNALARANTIQKTKNVLDMAVAAEIYAKRQKLGGEIELQATAIKVEALRQLGNMLKAAPKAKGGQPYQEYSTGTQWVPVENALPTLADMGLDKKTSKLAQDIAGLPEDQFDAVRAGVVAISKAVRQNKQEETREVRKAKNIPDGKYNLIYADAPWRYDFSQSTSREIENQYPTMDVDEICALPISSLADSDCVLFMWATNPKLREALQVIDAWGFVYKTNMVWVKDKIGMGYYARQKHEILMIATKGNPGTPEPKDRPESVVFADRTKHSRKPQEFYEILEGMYPHSRKIELFSRLERNGWSAWGNE